MKSLIAAVALNSVIGYQGGLPWDIPEDRIHFRNTTLGKVVVMGRLTYESIPKKEGICLPERQIVVLTRNPNFDTTANNVTCARTLSEAIEAYGHRDIVVAGGAKIYEEALPLVEAMYITHVEQRPLGDTFFPEVNWAEWIKTSTIFGSGFKFCSYRRK